MVTVVCVLRSGGDFKPEHVARLRNQIEAHTPGCDFRCLTDDAAAIGCAPIVMRLEHGWPGWWSKLEVFRLPGPVLYLDLDVTITGDLSPLLAAAAEHDFVMCRGFWGADDPTPVNSSVMAWRGDASRIYRAFLEAPAAFMSLYCRKQKWGDQAFIRDHWGGPIALWQDVLPGKVVSFKREVSLLRRFPWQDACVVVSHGLPRPWAHDGADAWLARRKPRLLGSVAQRQSDPL